MKEKAKKSPLRVYLIRWLCIIILCTSAYFMFLHDYIRKAGAIDITYNEVVQKVSNNEIYKIEIDNIEFYAYEYNKSTLDQLIPALRDTSSIVYKITYSKDNSKLIELLKDNKRVNIVNNRLSEKCIQFGILFICLAVFYFLVCAANDCLPEKWKGKPREDLKDKKDVGVKSDIRFKDIAGCEEAKESLQELVDFLKNSKKYTKIGAKLPKGALMVGSPGTGKTLLAKAVAGEAGVPFFYKSASEFVEMYQGVGAQRMRDLFKKAKEHAPAIIFIDELDAIGKARGDGSNSNDGEKDQTLNQLLTEMDGFEVNKSLIVLGATNRPEILDQALLRPGRFDRQVVVDKPDLIGRISILKVHAKKLKLDNDINFDELGMITSGMVGADLANACNEAAIEAVRNKRSRVSQKDFKTAIETVMVGKEKKDRVLDSDEKRIVAVHETGHAIIGAICTGSTPISKISIVPVANSVGALGYVLHLPDKEKFLKNKKEMIEQIFGLLGGRAAEEIIFGKDNVTNGASNDLEKVAGIIKAMITQYGMSERFGLYSVVKARNTYLNNGTYMECSPALQADIDNHIQTRLKEYYETTKEMIIKNRPALDKISNYLYEHEKITGKEFMELFNKYKSKE